MKVSQETSPEMENPEPLFDEHSDVSIVSKLPGRRGTDLAKIYSSQPCCHEFFGDEAQMKKHMLAVHSYKPTPVDNRVRYNFWFEYEESIRSGRSMDLDKVAAFVITKTAMLRLYFMYHPSRTLWMLMRPMGYEQTVEEMLHHGLTRMREILDMSPYEANGKVNNKLLDLQVKITAMMDFRVNGAPKQQIQNLNLNVHKDLRAGENINSLVSNADMGAIKERLAAISSEKLKLEGRAVELSDLKNKSEETPIQEAILVESARKES